MKSLILITLHLLVAFSTFSQSAFDKALSEISADLAEKLSLKGKKKTVVLYITDFNKTPSVTGKYLADIISSNIVNHPGNFMVFDRDNLGGIAEINTLISEGYLTEDITQKIGKILSVETIIVGTYTILGNSIKLSVKALDVTTAFVIASSLKDLPLDNDAGALLGINVTSSNDSNINLGNRGFNNVPLSSNEKINNPNSVSPDCLTNNTGDYCFENKTKNKIYVLSHSAGVLYLSPDQTLCFYNILAMNHDFRLELWENERPSQTLNVGEFLVEKCKSKTFVIK